MEQQINLSLEQTEAIGKIYVMLASSFPSFHFGYDSEEFGMWKLALANYPAEAVSQAADEIPTLRKPNGMPYDFAPSLAVITNIIMHRTVKLMGYSDHDKTYERLFKFKRKTPAERSKTQDHFVYTLYRRLNRYMGMNKAKFDPIFTKEYVNLVNGLTRGATKLDQIPLCIEDS